MFSCTMHYTRWRFSRLHLARWSSTVPVGTLGVSSHGRLQNKSGVIGWGHRRRSGYHVTQIGGRPSMVHRLVARAFLGLSPSREQCQVHHKDGDRSNNRADNLEYVTPSQNIMYSYAASTPRRTSAEVLSKPVIAKLLGHCTWSKYASASGAARQLGVDHRRIHAVCKGARKSTGGYEFRYADRDVFVSLPGEEWRVVIHPVNGRVLSSTTVSSLGRVMSSRRISWGCTTAEGYRHISISHEGQSSMHYVHRLVARAFLGPAPNPRCNLVHHRDSNRLNNHVENLEYVTPAENIRHSFRSNSDRGSHAQARSKPVWGRALGNDEWILYPSRNEAARQLGVSSGNISRCCLGFGKRAGRFEFKYAATATPQLLPGEEWREVIWD